MIVREQRRDYICYVVNPNNPLRSRYRKGGPADIRFSGIEYWHEINNECFVLSRRQSDRLRAIYSNGDISIVSWKGAWIRIRTISTDIWYDLTPDIGWAMLQ
jgi:hypothetical protein